MITIASVPTAHRYVEHLDPVRPSVPTTIRLPDPTPDGVTMPGQWWPPRWLEPDWLEDHADEFDILHIHFGFDSLPVEQLSRVARVVHERDKPLVVTVHDLHNPHFPDNTLHLRHLNELVTAADEVVTVTHSAAAEIAGRWNIEATVIPHPHVVPLDLVGHRTRREETFVVGLHAKSLRANLDPLAVADTLVRTVNTLEGARLRVDIDDGVFAEASPSRDTAAALRALDIHDRVDVRVHPRFTDDELWAYLAEIDVSVMPYRFGTHSGWLEACHDLGVAAVTPDCGYYADQKPCYTYRFGFETFDPDSLSDAVRDAYTHRSTVPAATRGGRTAERDAIAAAHLELYERALRRRATSVAIS